MSQNKAKEAIFTTRGIDGQPRTWGICQACGHVDEIAPSKILLWQWRALCETCEADEIAESEMRAAERIGGGI